MSAVALWHVIERLRIGHPLLMSSLLNLRIKHRWQNDLLVQYAERFASARKLRLIKCQNSKSSSVAWIGRCDMKSVQWLIRHYGIPAPRHNSGRCFINLASLNLCSPDCLTELLRPRQTISGVSYLPSPQKVAQRVIDIYKSNIRRVIPQQYSHVRGGRPNR